MHKRASPFTNDFETRTQSIDLVATYTLPSLGGNSTFSFIFNHTDTRVTKFNPQILDAVRIRQLQEAIPKMRWNFTTDHSLGRLRLLGRLSYYDDWYDCDQRKTLPIVGNLKLRIIEADRWNRFGRHAQRRGNERAWKA